MKRVALLILALLLLADLAEDGCLGKANFNLPKSTATTSLASSDQPDSGKTDFRHKLAWAGVPGIPRQIDYQSETLIGVPLTLQIILRSHFSSSGGLSP